MYSTRLPRSDGRVSYTRHELLNMNNTALCPPSVHRRLVKLQLSRSSLDPGPATKRPKHRPFQGGRWFSLTRNRTLPRGRNLDNVIQIPLTATVIDSSSCSRSFLKFAHINVRSRRNKTVQIHNFIAENEFDILFMTETWLYDQGDEAYVTEMIPDGFQFHSFPRCGKRGGGIALVSKCSLKSISIKRLNYQSFEAVEAKLFHCGKSMSLACLYRPPPSRVKSMDKMFQDGFSGLVAYLVSGTCESVIVDFNNHLTVVPVPMLNSDRPCSVTTVCPHVKQLQTLFSDTCLSPCQTATDPVQ